ncbi:ammonia monooxygenase subunit C [Nitrosomonas eutropha]|uniref:methane monooxygenase/ammonia monooxygenase subunit C n=1 Tax=Nitrosomonas TaxID=914 RepID=UPI00089C7348|nr:MULTISPECIES: methane monooxygenase/ammonia monooxygenase subunit C [Nitrosomonas]MXS80264.1 methane monooxygenase/ammonia monooxygenase subunit C [Nitrosomonas sp. GH22]SDW32785.1 ammonia monooxygenase subunit C [Nitrosomonas eutropha]
MATNILKDKATQQVADKPTYDKSEWFDAKYYKFGLLPILAVAVMWVYFQRTYAYSHGMDSMEPEFDRIWMGLWRVQMAVLPLIALFTWGWLYKTRNTAEQLANLTPKQEIKRYFYFLMWLGVYIFAVYWGSSFFTEQDASWHQVIIRDTSFTPSHIPLFYGSFPVYIIMGVSMIIYANTRLPLYNKGWSFPLIMTVAGPLMSLPNVGLNEWGHAFWFMEELFSAPLHWGFVILAWAALFQGGLAVQIIARFSNLLDVEWNKQDRAILDDVITAP